MILEETFTWFNLLIAKQSKLIYAVPWIFYNGCLKILSWANSLIVSNNIRSITLDIKTTDVKLLKY